MFRKIKKLLQLYKNSCYTGKAKERIGGLMVYRALDVARYVINYANDNNMIMSNLKLQKVLYFIQLEYLLQGKNEPCFSDDIAAWEFGPVVPSVYFEFKKYGALPIPKILYMYDDSKGLWNLSKREYCSSIKDEDRKIIEDVVNVCNKYSASHLVEVTHRQMPWKKAYTNKGNNIISVECIKDYINSLKG